MMKFLIFLTVLGVTFATPIYLSSNEVAVENQSSPDYLSWAEFKREFGKLYYSPEDAMRQEIYEKNLEHVKEHNERYQAGEESYLEALNQYSDWTDEELSHLHGLKPATQEQKYPTWEQFKEKYGKSYPTEEEDSMRQAIFEKNLQTVETHNEEYKRGESSFQMNVNAHSDWTDEELSHLHGLKPASQEQQYPTWEQFKEKYGKSYPTEEEDSMRQAILEKNLQTVETHNEEYKRGESSFQMNVNAHSDWTDEELSHLHGLKPATQEQQYPTWEQFKEKYGKSYPTEEEDSMRQAIFEKNLQTVETHNEEYKRGESSFQMNVNAHSDWTDEELSHLHGLKPASQEQQYPTWEQFKEKYGKSYPTEEEDSMRQAIFEKNLQTVETHNEEYKRGESSFQMNVNAHSDWTDEELSHLHGLKPATQEQQYPTWEQFKEKYDKTFSAEEDEIRRDIYETNLQIVKDHNEKFQKGEISFNLGINQTSDWTKEELTHRNGTIKEHDEPSM